MTFLVEWTNKKNCTGKLEYIKPLWYFNFVFCMVAMVMVGFDCTAEKNSM